MEILHVICRDDSCQNHTWTMPGEKYKDCWCDPVLIIIENGYAYQHRYPAGEHNLIALRTQKE